MVYNDVYKLNCIDQYGAIKMYQIWYYEVIANIPV